MNSTETCSQKLDDDINHKFATKLYNLFLVWCLFARTCSAQHDLSVNHHKEREFVKVLQRCMQPNVRVSVGTTLSETQKARCVRMNKILTELCFVEKVRGFGRKNRAQKRVFGEFPVDLCIFLN